MCISTSKRMLAHAFAWSKLMENIPKSWKSTFFFIRTRGSCRLMKKNKEKSYLGAFRKNKCVLIRYIPSSTWASRIHDGKGTFSQFQMFFIFFNHVNACASMHSLAEIHNRAQLKGKKGFWDWEKSGVDFRVDVGSHAGDRVCRLMYESE